MDVGVYLRISFDDERTGLGIQRQEEDARKLCERQGWSVGRVYTDESVSAYKRVVRPAWRQLLADLEAGTIKGMVAYDIDRVARQPRDLEALLDIYEAHPSRVFATVAGELDLAKTDGRFIARLLVNVANKASADTGRRVARSHLQLAQQGKPAGGGNRPYGYEADRLTVCQPEAEVIREIAGRVIAGESLTSICRNLDSRNIPTPTGLSQWDRGVIKRIIINPRIAGLRYYRGSVMLDANFAPIRAKWDAILPALIWEQARIVLTDPKRSSNAGRIDRQYLLSGFLRCKCGAKMYGVTKNGIPNYVCPTAKGCGKTHRRGVPLDKHITELVLRYLERQELPPTEPERDELASFIHEAESDLAALIDQWTEGNVSNAVFFAAQAKKEQVLNNLKRQRTQARRSVRSFVGQDVRQAWKDSNLSQQRAILSAVMLAIEVKPKPANAPKTFDPAYYNVIWR